MRLRPWIVRSLLLATAVCRPAAATSIPPCQGELLTGQRVELPAALHGKVAVLVVGFSQASRDEVTAWGKRLAFDYRDSPTVLYYEMPVLASVPRLVRGWVLARIKSSVPPRAQQRFLPILDHEPEWKQAAGYTRPQDAYILLVDAGGTVHWKTEGAATDAAYNQLKQQLVLWQAK